MAEEETYDLREDLKIANDDADLTWKGKLFESLDPATEKARSPLDLHRQRGTDKSKWLEHLSALDGE